MNRVTGSTLLKYPGLLDILKLRYLGRGRSKREVAGVVKENHPELSLKPASGGLTCGCRSLRRCSICL